ncbi:SseB family protein [Streptomyces olivoverticillatus]|uniref:SseB family protein n=1 Tax=Streptomyces olivoverticillatus TaxID=66427 RepID=UPI0031B56F99
MSAWRLTEEVAAVHAARGNPSALIGEFRRTAVLVPLDEAGGLWTVVQDGIRWVCAFTDEAALGRFAAARGEADARREWEYRSVWGARLLDVVVPALGVPAGVALDVGSPHPMLFPPVTGVVPEAVALDDPDNVYAHVDEEGAR